MRGIHPATLASSSPQCLMRKTGLTLRILQCPTFRLHNVLLHDTSLQMMNIPRIVDLPLEFACLIGCLSTSEDMEVVVCGMSTCVTLNPDSRSKDDQIPTC